ncbi:MAG TPA: hypothetical protein VIV40_43415, partial [Kofleriaceae bacterium]
FELIEFSNSPRRYHEEPLAATAPAKQAAIRWVRSRVADGGTEMRAGVIEALTTLRVGAQRQVVVVTDGYVGGEQQILEALNRRLPKSCRLHVLGVGSAVNRSLATSLSRAGRGVEVIVGIDDDAERGAKRLLDRTRSPMLTNVEISGSAVLRHAPAQMPDCFERAPLVCALAIKPEGGEILVRGQLARESWEQRIAVKPLQPGEGNQAIVALYGRERVADVEANAMFESVDGEIEDLGLTFQLATRMTSWVAIDEIRREVGSSQEQVIPQELPYGTTASAFGLRGPLQTSTRAGSVMLGAPAMMQAQFESEAGTSPDAMASIGAPPSFDMDDVGESAPSEPFEEERSVGSRSYPPAPAYSRRPMGGAPPPPARSAPPRPTAPAPRKPIADEFDAEEPTGQVAREPADAGSDLSAEPPRTYTQAPNLAVVRQAAPERKQRKTIPGMPAPAPSTTQLAERPRSATEAAKGAELEPAHTRAVMQQKRPVALWLALLALLALIALLIWWLAA